MSFPTWVSTALISAVSSSAVLTGIGFIVRTWWKAKIEATINKQVQKELEEIRASLRRDEEKWRNAVKRQDDEISALRSGALTAMISRQTVLIQRRIEAAERLWEAIAELNVCRFPLQVLAIIDYQTALEHAKRNDDIGRRVREFSADFQRTMEKIKTSGAINRAENERLHLPPEVWLKYEAYFFVCSYAVLQLSSLKSASDLGVALPDNTLKTIKSILPHWSSEIDQRGLSAVFRLSEELKDHLFMHLAACMESPDANFKAINQANQILNMTKLPELSVLQLNIPPSIMASDHRVGSTASPTQSFSARRRRERAALKSAGT